MADRMRRAVAERFGDNLIGLRGRKGISQDALARLASLHRTEIGVLEHGERVCRIDTLVRLAGAMEVPPVDLLDGIDWIPGPETTGTFAFAAAPRRREMRPMTRVKAPIERGKPPEARVTQETKERTHLRQGPKSRSRSEPKKATRGSHFEPSKGTNHGHRHTTNPPVPCPGRRVRAGELDGSQRPDRAPATAPSGGRLWHGSAVRRPLLRGGGRALAFGPGGDDRRVTRCRKRSRGTREV